MICTASACKRPTADGMPPLAPVACELPRITADDLAERYPSHLHINLVPRLQGRGIGRRLIATLISALRDHGSRGLHLLVGRANQHAVGFYRHVGFSELPATDVHTFVMQLSELAE